MDSGWDPMSGFGQSMITYQHSMSGSAPSMIIRQNLNEQIHPNE